MGRDYDAFVAYLNTNQVRFKESDEERLVRFGYNIEVGTIEVVVDFEHEGRIAFFSFLNIAVPIDRKAESLVLVNLFNESLNYGSIIVSQGGQLVYKIMLSTFDVPVADHYWAEVIYRLWSISRDIFPLFGRLLYNEEDAVKLFQEFLLQKESDNELDHSAMTDDLKTDDGHKSSEAADDKQFGSDSEGWFLQN